MLERKSVTLTSREAAEYLGLSDSWLRQTRVGIAEGPRYVKIGKAVRYRLTDLDEFLVSRTRECGEL